MSSSQLSMMKTLRTYSLMLFFFFLFSKRSKGALRGTNKSARNSSCPSTEKCCEDNKTIGFERFSSNLSYPNFIPKLQTYLDGKMILPVVGQTLVELTILFVSNVIRVTSPQGFGLIKLFLIYILLLNFLFLLFVSAFVMILIIGTDVFNLWLVFIFLTFLFSLILFFFFLSFIITYLFVTLFFYLHNKNKFNTLLLSDTKCPI